jgi:hypothetical protein
MVDAVKMGDTQGASGRERWELCHHVISPIPEANDVRQRWDLDRFTAANFGTSFHHVIP